MCEREIQGWIKKGRSFVGLLSTRLLLNVCVCVCFPCLALFAPLLSLVSLSLSLSFSLSFSFSFAGQLWVVLVASLLSLPFCCLLSLLLFLLLCFFVRVANSGLCAVIFVIRAPRTAHCKRMLHHPPSIKHSNTRAHTHIHLVQFVDMVHFPF